jgi:mRNA-degrading endonuclease RelE of RelBE toxin-antitoxin system
MGRARYSIVIEIRFTAPFQRRYKALSKRYRRIKDDIQPIIAALEAGEIIGNQIPGTDFTVFKVRAKNSDIPAGKSGGYRVIYQLSTEFVSLLLIYAKSDLEDVSTAEIEDAIANA